MLPSGERTRWVKPVPGAVFLVDTTSATNSRSAAKVVVTAGAVAVVPLPVPDDVTSTGVARSAPLYSTMRRSGEVAPLLNVAVTVLVPAAAAAMFLA